jgi:hypothetical protein
LRPTTSPFPSSGPTSLYLNSLNAVFIVTGICNSCEDKIVSTNPIDRGFRQLLGPYEQGADTFATPRFLQEENMSNCFCPASTFIRRDLPSGEKVEEAFQSRIRQLNMLLKIKKLDDNIVFNAS